MESTMVVISPQTFQANPRRYFERANREKVVIKDAVEHGYRLAPTKIPSTCMTKEEFFARLDESVAQYRRGEYVAMEPAESVDDFIHRICTG